MKKSYLPLTLDQFLNESKSITLKRGYGKNAPVVVGAALRMEDILRPKSEEEILSQLGDLNPSELLVKSSEIGFLSGVKFALKNGADVHARGDFALRWASRYGHKDVVELLLKNGADIHAYDGRALQLASNYGYKDIVEILLKNGADVHARNDYALQLATANGHKDIVELLKKYM